MIENLKIQDNHIWVKPKPKGRITLIIKNWNKIAEAVTKNNNEIETEWYIAGKI